MDYLDTLLVDLDFSRDEIDQALYELDEYRSIPGTAHKKYPKEHCPRQITE